MKRPILAILLLSLIINLAEGSEKINIIVIGAHPDDCDVDAGGTAALWAKQGCNVLFVSLTNGDAGHHEKTSSELAKIRLAESQEAGKRLGVKYVVLDNHDGELMPTLKNRQDVIRLIREWKADVVIGPRPNDYHPDHRNTAILIQDAAYLVIVPRVVPDTPPLKKNPVFLYTSDRFQKPIPFKPDISIDISDVFDQKIYAMAAHKSQFFEWLPWTTGKLEQVPKSEEAKLEWLKKWRKPKLNDDLKQNLKKWYGKDKAETIQYAESFEICEYGRKPSDEEIIDLFPMLKNQFCN